MSKTEFVSLAGLRLDGRRSHEIRRFQTRFGIFKNVDGSCYLEQGNTKVLVAIYGPHEPHQRSKTLHDRAILTCSVNVAPFSSTERRKRRANDRRNIDISLMIQQTFEAAINTKLHPRSQIDICVQIIQSDGSLLATAINASTFALVDAGIPMIDFVCACSVGYLDGTPLLDLCHLEESAGGPELTVGVLAKTSEICLLQMESKLSLDIFQDTLTLALEGTKQIDEYMQSSVKERTHRLLQSRGGLIA